MKSLAFGFASLAGLVLSAILSMAADYVTVEAVIRHGKNANPVAAPRVMVESGQEATITIGELQLTMTPTKQADGTITIASKLVQAARNARPVTIAQPTILLESGKTGTVQVGSWEMAFTPSVVK